MAPTYWRRSTTIEAVRWAGTAESLQELFDFAGKAITMQGATPVVQLADVKVSLSVGDYILRDPEHGLDACSPAVFEALYLPEP